MTRARARFSARFFSHSQAFRNRSLWCLLGQAAFSVWELTSMTAPKFDCQLDRMLATVHETA